ncbi:hypothetical protein TSUD_171950 [Trifolium subterraneum]|uniref:Uncharacterized protein n=1 Tax=Trifolium subterraneum TaxID=3900 RepID=A0A2Z6MNV2_TRISU|nr:hypothetical protein TSUD_171950 [Trifolium subterraneum]
MVFPSLPIYQDPPNWSPQQEGIGIGTQNPSPLQQPSASTVTITVEADGSYQGSIRHGSMTDQAKMSKIHQRISHFPTQFPFLASLHHYNNNDYVSQGIGSMVAKNITNSTNTSVEFQLGSGFSIGNSTNGGSLLLSNGIGEQWKFPNSLQVHQQQQQQPHQENHQQFPFLTSLEPQIGLFQFGGENNDETQRNFIRSKATDSSSVTIGMVPQVNIVKMEENNCQGLSLSKNLLNGSGNSSNLFWNGNGSGSGNANAWNESPNFTPSPSQLL